MSIREQILQITVSDPQYQQSISAIKQQLATTNLVSEDLVEAIKMLEFVFQNPEKYSEVREATIADGLIDEGMFPLEFNEVLIVSILAVLYAMQEELNQKGYARGGLKVGGRQLDFGGQGGDTMLAHINPREAEVLRRMGGQGTVNPNTGLKEYKGLKDALKIALPIALTFVAGPLGGAIGTSLTAGTAFAGASSIIGGAIVGAGSSALTSLISGEGLDFKTIALGALSGGIGGAAGPLGNIIGGATNLSTPVATMAAGALTGAGQAALRGDDLGSGAVKGIISQAINKPISNMSGRASEGVVSSLSKLGNVFDASSPSYSGVSDAIFSEQGSPIADTFVDTNTFDFMAPNPSMASYSDNELLGGSNFEPARAGVVTDMGPLQKPRTRVENIDEFITKLSYNPTNSTSNLDTDEARVQSYNSPQNPALGNATKNVNYPNPNNSTSIPTPAVSKADALSNMNAIEGSMAEEGMLSNLLSSDAVKIGGITALLASMDGGSAEGVGPPKLTKAQEEYFNSNLATWDWGKIQAAANAKGTNVTEFIINDKFQSEANSGMFNQKSNYVTPRSLVSQRYARGGLSAIPGYATGSGDGRDDLINARLSDGEYVIDAESVSMLGNGSNKAGASMLNQMRKNLRSHKGKALADGRFSPDAKSPLEYMKRSA